MVSSKVEAVRRMVVQRYEIGQTFTTRELVAAVAHRWSAPTLVEAGNCMRYLPETVERIDDGTGSAVWRRIG